MKAYVLAADPTWIQASVRSYYDVVEEIIVSYDRAGLGWTGAPIPVRQCLEKLEAIDHDRKMRFHPGDFARLDRAPLVNDTAQRQWALEEAGKGTDWVLEIDSDEVLPDARRLVRRLTEEVPAEYRSVEWPMRPFFQRAAGGGYLEVATRRRGQLSEYPGCIAARPGVRLTECRRTDERRWRFDIPQGVLTRWRERRAPAQARIAPEEAILHFSWVRREEDLRVKLQSWGHSRELDVDAYVREVWRAAPERWRELRNFHPVWPAVWPALRVGPLPEAARRFIDPAAT